jgi:hypothetical protein
MKRLPATVAIVLALCAPALQAGALEPFVARYDAYNGGRAAGSATMRVVRSSGPRWRVDLEIDGNRGLAGVVGLDIDQSTAFEVQGGQFRPISQSTTRKALVFGRRSTGTYDWTTRTARWTGDLKAARRQPIALRDGDLSGLLINLAILRDAEPGKQLQYRFVDGGRVREHRYAVSAVTESVRVGDLSYEALRVSRINDGNDETIVWITDGVPTPVRILQRQDGRDGIDLRLTEYQGVQ